MNPIFDLHGLRTHVKDLQQPPQSSKLLSVQPAQAWLVAAQQRPIPRMLFSEFWFEGELCMLFADTNLGKSILAVQLADSISRGAAIAGFRNESTAQRVLYVDFELSDKQFEARYSQDFSMHYDFSAQFLRAELSVAPGAEEDGGQFEALLHAALEAAVVEHKVKVLIVDNITYLSCETERARHALPLMKQLKRLQRQHGLSVLTLAHTPKRDMTRPLTRNDLQGSKMLINFCDTAFAIGESQQDSGIRYLKQIKARNVEVKYHSEQVCICQIEKPSNFLRFTSLGYGAEYEHLRQESASERSNRKQQALEMKAAGSSNVAIARELGIAESTVRNWLKKQGEAAE